jgi:hypothetical protein
MRDGCLVAGGDGDFLSFGIVAQNGTSIDINDSIVLSGVVDPDKNNHTELASIALNLSGGSLFAFNNVHFMAMDAIAQSSAIFADAAGTVVELWQSTLIAGSAQDSIGFHAANIGDFVMYNSVILADDSTGGGTSTGVYLENIPAGGTPVRLSGNTIGVRRGDPGDTYGIQLVNTTDVEVHNNLVWSANAVDMVGLDSNAGPVDRVRHNNFWDDDDDVVLNLDGSGDQPIAYWQDFYPTATTRGNIRRPLSIDTTFSLSSGDFDVGRITGSRPDDVVYGGEDLTGLGSGAPYPPDYDRDGRWRSPSAGVGYSMGAFEYGNDTYLPSSIHVAMSANGGDDGHPLGTAERPFASLARAYDAARGPTPRWDAWEIRVQQGNFDVSTAAKPLPMFTDDIRMTGGWNASFGSRNPRSTNLIKTDAGPLMQFGGAVS